MSKSSSEMNWEQTGGLQTMVSSMVQTAMQTAMGEMTSSIDLHIQQLLQTQLPKPTMLIQAALPQPPMQSLPQSLLGYRFVDQCINTSLISSMPVITSGGANMGGASLFTAITTMSITPSPILSPSTPLTELVPPTPKPHLLRQLSMVHPPSYPKLTRGENLEAGLDA